MIGSASARAVNVDPSSPNFGKQVAMTVTNDSGYPARKVGSYRITYAVQNDIGYTKTITATVTGGTAPTLTVPATRRVPASGGSFNYMQGVSASDAEDGTITSKVIYNTPVNMNNPGAYRVTYSVTDSDGNTTQKNGVVLVGTGWVVRSGYALYAEDFARRLSAIAGTSSEATRLAKAMAISVSDQSSTNFGGYVSTRITNLGGYKKASGTYYITFAVSAQTSVTKQIKASISDDTPRAPVTNVTNRTTNTTNTPTPNVTVNPADVTVNQPEQPTTTVPEVETPTTSPAIEDIKPTPTPLTNPPVWNLLDLLLVIGSLILGFYLMLVAMRRKEEDETTLTASRGKQIRMWGVLGVILGIASVAILLLTQKFVGNAVMQLADIWAILFAAIFGVELLATIGVNSKQNDEWSEERSI
jgi:hypothetical protein